MLKSAEEWEVVEKQVNLHNQALTIEVMCDRVMITRSSKTSFGDNAYKMTNHFQFLDLLLKSLICKQCSEGNELDILTQEFPSFSAFQVIGSSFSSWFI